MATRHLPATDTQRLTDLALKAEHELLTAKELGELLDMHKRNNIARLRIDKESAELKAIESAAEQLVIKQMRTQEITAAGGQMITAKLNPVKYAPQVGDWPAFYAHIVATNDFSLLQKRVSDTAVRERWEDEKLVPGVEKFPVYTLSKSVVKS